jgi:Membrane proteins related to metalloendopeptidases
MKTNLCILILFAFVLPIFSQIAFTFSYPVGKRYGHEWPRDKDGHRFLDPQENCFHPGLDFNKAGTVGNEDEGQPVKAVANGIVVESYFDPSWGNIIMIKHQLPDKKNVYSVYAHLKDRFVSAGDKVEEGDLIGTVGRGPDDIYEAHLHFEMRKGNLGNQPARFFPGCQSAAWIKDHYFEPRAFIDAHNIYLPLTFCYKFTAVKYYCEDTVCLMRIESSSGNETEDWQYRADEPKMKYLAYKFTQRLFAKSQLGKNLYQADKVIADQAGFWKIWNQRHPDDLQNLAELRLKAPNLSGTEKVIYRPADYAICATDHNFFVSHETPQLLDSGEIKYFAEREKTIDRLENFCASGLLPTPKKEVGLPVNLPKHSAKKSVFRTRT